MQQAVEQVLPGLAAYGQPAGPIRARAQAALHGPADRIVFSLNLVADIDAGEIAGASLLRDIGEVEIEDDLCLVNAARDDEVRVHRTRVAVDHEVRIDPVVARAIPSADVASAAVGPVTDDRTPLQAEPFAVLNRVLAVIEHAVQALVQKGHVVAAVEIVIDKDLPVAVERVVPPLHPVQLFEHQRPELHRQLRADEIVEGEAAPEAWLEPD